MYSWVRAEDVSNTIMPEINRIWRKAGIVFKLENIFQNPGTNPQDKSKLIVDIIDARRDSQGKSDPKRIKKLNKLINWDNLHPNAINVYLVPYLGEKSQGNAKPRHRLVLIGQWTDKSSKARNAPEKFQLTESMPFKKGSLSRTVAHEIGHVLGLKHPDKKTQSTFGLLMGGKKAGYSLTQTEIETARRNAVKILNY